MITYDLFKFPSDGFNVVFPSDGFNCAHEIFETLTDSKGGKHNVCVERVISVCNFNLNDYHIKIGNYSICLSHNKWNIQNVTTIQLDFEWYAFFTYSRGREGHVCAMEYIRDQIEYREKPKWFRNWDAFNDFDIRNAIKNSGYYPLYEDVVEFARGNYINHVTDKFFFNYPDRKIALDRISDFSRRAFDGFDYINADDHQILKFMNERFKRQIEFERSLPRK